MTLTIVNHFTHEKTFTVVGKPNGAEKKLRDRGYELNPRIHDDAYLPPFFYFFNSQSDGSQAGQITSTAQDEPPPPFVINTERESEEPSDFFGRRKE